MPDTIDIGSTITVELGGVIKATVDGAGIHLTIDPGAAIGGNNPLSVALKSPTGIGLSLDTGLIRGGGFLGERAGGYGGALQLRLGPVEVKAVGLLTLEPSFALVVVMSMEFLPPIDLSFGFTLNAVGGVVGIEHRLDSDALRAGMTGGALDHIMFPADPVAAAPAILSTLEQVFPVDHGAIVIGPMVEVGWGRPVSFLTAQVGVILSLPDPKIVIIGRVRIALPGAGSADRRPARDRLRRDHPRPPADPASASTDRGSPGSPSAATSACCCAGPGRPSSRSPPAASTRATTRRASSSG